MAESIKEQAERLKVEIESLKKRNDLSEDEKRLLADKQQALKSINEELFKSVGYLEDQKKRLELQLGTLKEISSQTGIQVDVIRQISEIEQARLQIEIKKLEKQLEATTDTDEQKKIQIAIVELLKAQTKEIEKQKELARAEQAGKTLANLLGFSEANKNSLTYQLFANPKTVMDGLKKEINAAGGLLQATFLNIGMKIQEATLLAFKQTDSAISGFVAATGASAEYNEVIANTARGNTALGISFAQSGKAVTDLYTGLNTFTRLNQSAQEELTVTTAKLEKLGISGGDTAKSIATLSQMMQISETQAAKTVEEFAAMGQAIGVSSKQMISDFIGVKDQLAVFGSEMSKVFTDLAAQSKATGVAVNDLLTLANKFDTFNSAATNVAKLNAMLGGPYLSTMAMIEATDPTERIDMLRQAVDNAGVAFEDLSYYEKKAIMEAGGFKSVEEAQRVLSMSAGAYANELENQRASQEELNNAIERSQSIQDKLTLIMANFAIVMEKPVYYLSEFLSVVLKVMDAVPFLSYVLGGLIVAFTLLKIAQSIQAMFLALKGALFGVAPAAAAATPAIEGAGVGMQSAAAKMAAAAPAILVSSKALGILALVLLAVGAAVVMVGFGLKLMFEGLASVIKEGVKAPEVFLGIAAAVLALSFAVNTMGLNPMAIIGMAMLVTSIYAIAEAINSVEAEKVLNFKVMMEKVVEISEPSTAAQFTQFKEDFKAVAKATADLDITRMSVFSNMLSATQNLSQNLQLKQDIKVMIDGKEVAARIERITNGVPLATAVGR